MEVLQAAIVALIGTGTPILITLGLLLLGGWGISKMPKSSSEAIRMLHDTLTQLRADVSHHDRKQDEMHTELREAQGRLQNSMDTLNDKVGVLSERVARHEGILENRKR